MYYVYIIYSNKLKKKYIGYTEDLKNRVKQHNQRKVVFTSKGTPWQLIYYESFCNKLDAQEEERFLKTGKGRERLLFLLKNTITDN
ncbi:MAG TPA: GIY-YIG nuclease family protein [Candidatus Magasanikbacteria bacterium]|nr:GIY-YIG nuclease family protein [Candidatus Magasanikbacteria bacterium]